MTDDFLRVTAASPSVTVADPEANAKSIIGLLGDIRSDNPDVVVLPELCITAYTCGDLFHNRTLLGGALEALMSVCKATAESDSVVVAGCPIEWRGALYNCAVVMAHGCVKAVVPKTYVPNYNEFYEKRHWASAPVGGSMLPGSMFAQTDDVPFGTDVMLRVADALVGVEICEDLWTVVPPGCSASLAGAELVLNLSASDDLIGKYDYLMRLISQQSARCIGAYAYASAGWGESSTDLVFDAKCVVAENGRMLAVNDRWTRGSQWVTADVDIAAIRHDRMHTSSFHDCMERGGELQYRIIDCGNGVKQTDVMRFRTVDPHPFVPSSDERRRARCEEIIHIQSCGLAKRLQHTHCKSLVIGISGGLDSTLALLVAVRAFDMLGLDRKGIMGVTMPGFGTTGRTHRNAVAMMEALGVTIREVSIVPAVKQHFADIGQDPDNHDVTYENSQARERTQILMDLANKSGGMVLGTGDMSELALGWATYNGDHMSMYGVNAGVPKTLVRYLVQYFADTTDSSDVRSTLLDVVDTPVSPELIPPEADGTIAQRTEDLVGPYELHDFFLYYMLRFGFGPRRIYDLACVAFAGTDYTLDVIKKWLTTFMRRFFAQQFKRSCLPDGPKVGSICLSPRGDWRMPSDASAALWLKECESL